MESHSGPTALLAEAFRLAGTAACVIDAEGRHVFANTAYCDLVGFDAEELIGRPFTLLLPPGMRSEAMRSYRSGLSAEGTIPLPPEATLVRKDGCSVVVSSTSHLHTNAKGERLVVSALTDISRYKETEHALRKTVFELEQHVEARTAELSSANIRLQAEIAERRLAEQCVRHMAQHDALTGLPNRILLKDRLSQAIALAQRNSRHVAVMFLDLDRFKTINDSLGHMVGDHLLKEVAHRIQHAVRASDTVSRLGGDEFVVVLPELDNPRESILIAETLIEALEPVFSINGHDLHVTPSIGICVYPRDGENFETLMRNADTAMYQAKASGRNGFRFFTPQMNLLAAQHFQLETSLRRAIAQDELRLYFQPIVSLPEQQVCGMEVLLRWQHPKHGLLPPAEFIGIAEETGLIVPIGEWVIKQACLQNKLWREMGRPIVPLSINLSARQFHQPGLVEMIRRTLEETGQQPELLELEITETTLMRQSPQTSQTLEELGGMGISLSIDDFGTGYSSLSYLKRLPVHKLKIDRSFIQDINDNSDDLAIVSAVIALARTLQLEVVAEGVESKAHLDLLSRLGCELAQGYHISLPLPPGGVARFFDLETAG